MYCTVWICPIAIRLWRVNFIVRTGQLFFNMLEAHEKHRRVTNMKRGCRNSAASVLCGLLIFRSSQCQLEVLSICEDLLLIRILLLLYRALDDQRQYQYIDGQGCDRDHTLRYGVDQSRTDSGIHEAVSVSPQQDFGP